MAGLLPIHKTTPACICHWPIPRIVSLSTHSMNTRLPCSGPCRKFILAFDVVTSEPHTVVSLIGSPLDPASLFARALKQFDEVSWTQEKSYLDEAPDIALRFDKTTKLRFRDPAEPQYIKFGSLKDKDPRVGIRSGQIRLNGCVPVGCVRVHCY